jgi:hypothetical protein
MERWKRTRTERERVLLRKRPDRPTQQGGGSTTGVLHVNTPPFPRRGKAKGGRQKSTRKGARQDPEGLVVSLNPRHTQTPLASSRPLLSRRFFVAQRRESPSTRPRPRARPPLLTRRLVCVCACALQPLCPSALPRVARQEPVFQPTHGPAGRAVAAVLPQSGGGVQRVSLLGSDA